MLYQPNDYVLLAIFAHPDDETFRAGGMLTLLARQGVRVQVVTATRGEAGSAGQTSASEPEELAILRENELCCACQVLQIEPPLFLDYKDGHLEDQASGKLRDNFLQIMEEVQPQILLSFGPDGLSGHPDHIAIGRCAVEAFQKYQKAGALYHLAVPVSVKQSLGMNQIIAVPDQQVTVSLDVFSVWETKMKAIRCHASQLSSSPIMSQSYERQLMFLSIEHYICFLSPNPDKDFIPILLKDYFQ